MSEVAPINPLPKTHQYTDTTTKVITSATGQDKVIQTNYIVTVYDREGQLSTYSTNYQINYLI